MADDDPQLLLLRRQYFQTFEPDFLAWPSPQLLRNADAQTWLYRHLFDPARVARPPAARYQLRVLDLLVARVKRALDAHEVSGAVGSSSGDTQLTLRRATCRTSHPS